MGIFDNGLEEPEVNFPDKVIQDIIKDFENATNNLVSLNIIELDDIGRIGIGNLNTTFQYQALLMSMYLKGYSFEVMRFCYGVSIYPVTVCVQSEIGEEMKIKKSIFSMYKTTCHDEKEYIKIIEAIFSTAKFKNTVGGLMKIARVKAETI